jgi:hypothetical protein
VGRPAAARRTCGEDEQWVLEGFEADEPEADEYDYFIVRSETDRIVIFETWASSGIADVDDERGL